jgi:hypothetical protein
MRNFRDVLCANASKYNTTSFDEESRDDKHVKVDGTTLKSRAEAAEASSDLQANALTLTMGNGRDQEDGNNATEWIGGVEDAQNLPLGSPKIRLPIRYRLKAIHRQD